MRRRTVLLVALGVVALLGAALVNPTPSAASAAPAAPAPAPNAVALTGPGVPDRLVVKNADQPDLFKHLFSEVNWLATRPGNAPNPDPTKLGAKYQLVVLIDDAAEQAYDIYPLAVGGPRVFRPAEQPKKKGAAAWFYGRVSMPDTLRAAGVPLIPASNDQPGMAGGSGNPTGPAGGQGGGVEPTQLGVVSTPSSEASIGRVFAQWQRFMLLVGGGALLLLMMLGAVTLLMRKP